MRVIPAVVIRRLTLRDDEHPLTRRRWRDAVNIVNLDIHIAQILPILLFQRFYVARINASTHDKFEPVVIEVFLYNSEVINQVFIAKFHFYVYFVKKPSMNLFTARHGEHLVYSSINAVQALRAAAAATSSRRPSRQIIILITE